MTKHLQVDSIDDQTQQHLKAIKENLFLTASDQSAADGEKQQILKELKRRNLVEEE